MTPPPPPFFLAMPPTSPPEAAQAASTGQGEPVAVQESAPLEPSGGGLQAAGMAAVLRPGTRRFFLSAAAGRAFELSRSEEDDSYQYYNSPEVTRLLPALRLEQQLGVHLMPGTSSGFSAAIVFQQVMLGLTRDFTFGPRLAGDFPVAPNLGVYLSPSAVLGYNLMSVEELTSEYGGYYGPPETSRSKTRSHRADLQFALAAKVLFGDRFYLMARPIDLEVVTDFTGYQLRWSVMAGFGLTLGRG